ncbi:hypothetical protein HHI36_022213 [Cryptolaemus montrouzieri]|uniref:Retrotransposon gag domain-containing protein n=1 Tax=Cryptolaemus montrouzieri TaxID=559131 RepID=A0ABD2MZ20_9CUCU
MLFEKVSGQRSVDLGKVLCYVRTIIYGKHMSQCPMMATIKGALFKFILKTRLSSSARLGLKQEYGTVTALISDVRIHLLTKKSSTALTVKLLKARQGDRTVQEFGKEFEQLFVDLTISQADGNPQMALDIQKLKN